MTDLPDLAGKATAALRELFAETPLQRNDLLSARYDADIWLKREDLTPVRSYKLRGAFNAMRKVRTCVPRHHPGRRVVRVPDLGRPPFGQSAQQLRA